MDFVHLHCHTEFSLLDGMPSVDEYVYKCNELGMDSIAITEHGNLRSMVKFAKASAGDVRLKGRKEKVEPVKPIYGIEFYVSHLPYKIKGVPDSMREKLRRNSKSTADYKINLKNYEYEKGYRKRYHCIAFAKNEVGMRNLLTLNYFAWKNGFYSRPRIDFDLLKKYSEGLVITTACIGGYVPQMILNGKEDDFVNWLRGMKKIFNDDLYLEIQPNAVEGQTQVNKMLVDLSDEFKIKTVATNDCHYVESKHSETHDVMLMIQTNTDMQSVDAWRFPDNSFYMKSAKEMFKSFRRNNPDLSKRSIRQAIETTREVADKCNYEFKFDKKKGLIPSTTKLLDGKTAREFVIGLCKKGWKEKNVSGQIKKYAAKKGISVDESKKIYNDRLKLELKRIFKMRFENYFVIVWDIVRFARQENIQIGAGRGSSAGSLVAYLLHVTGVDPIYYDLLFDRFLNENRIDYPDIDMDFQDDRRGEIISYMEKVYGKKHVALIGTFSRMQGKAALKDVSRVHRVPIDEVNKVSKHIVKLNEGDLRSNCTVVDSFEHDLFKEFDAKFPDVKRHAAELEGKAKSVGNHASGVQISPEPIHTIIPVEYHNVEGVGRAKVTSIDFRDCELLGLIKFDILGLRTLSVIRNCVNLIEQQHGVAIDLFNDIDIEDKAVLKQFGKGDYIGLFQYDSHGMQELTKGVKFESFEDVTVFNALYRPGGTRSGLAKQYVARKKGKKYKGINKTYDKITATTYGVLVYQEQIMQCFVEIAGYKPSDADSVRKLIGKSIGKDEMEKQRETFVKGAIEHSGMKEDAADALFTSFVKFSQYGFNKAHAAAYSVITFWCMWLRTKYPLEFYTALLNSVVDKDSNKRIAKLIDYVGTVRKRGYEVVMPDVNYSGKGFEIHDGKIVTGLVDVKGCGEKAALNLIANRPYKNIFELYDKVDRRAVNKGTLKTLAKAGAFESLGLNNNVVLCSEVNVKLKRSAKRMPLLYAMLEAGAEQGRKLYKYFDKKQPLTEDDYIRSCFSVCPIPPKQHLTSYYDEIDETVNVKTIAQVLKHVKDNNSVKETHFVAVKGVITELKYNNVGDYEDGEMSDLEKDVKMFGKRYARFIIEDASGSVRCFLPANLFPTFKEVVDKGSGTPVLVVGSVYTASRAVRITVDMLLDLNAFKDAFKAGKYGNEFHKFLIERKNNSDKLFNANPYDAHINEYVWSKGIITNIKLHLTKNEDVMAFVNVINSNAMYSVIVWNEQLEKYKKKLKQGSTVRLLVTRGRDSCFVATDAKKAVIVDNKNTLPYMEF